MSKPAARIGDNHVCPLVNPGPAAIPHVGGPISGAGVPTVLICGQPAAVVGDVCTCTGPPDQIAMGSSGVLIGGKPAARAGDMCAHGGSIVSGAPTVLIGEVGPVPTVTPPVVALLLNKLEKVVIEHTGASPSTATALAMARVEAALMHAARNGDRFADPTAFSPEMAPPPPTPCAQVAAMGNMEPKERIAAMKELQEELGPERPDLADKISADIALLEKAMLAEAVYDNPPNPNLVPDGYRTATKEDIKKQKLEYRGADDQTLFIEELPNGEVGYILAFRGSDNKQDAVTNVKNGLGFQDDAYSRALVSADDLIASKRPVEFVGHSKGGGQAAAAAMKTGMPATTFNSAGVHQNTIDSFCLAPDEAKKRMASIDAIHNVKDPLTKAQDNRMLVLSGLLAVSLVGPMLGNLLGAASVYAMVTGGFPAAIGKRREVPAFPGQGKSMNPKKRILENHSMTSMRRSLTVQQDAELSHHLGCSSV